MLRRIVMSLIAIASAGVVAAVLRIQGNEGIEPQTGGWRELTPNDWS